MLVRYIGTAILEKFTASIWRLGETLLRVYQNTRRQIRKVCLVL